MPYICPRFGAETVDKLEKPVGIDIFFKPNKILLSPVKIPGKEKPSKTTFRQ